MKWYDVRLHNQIAFPFFYTYRAVSILSSVAVYLFRGFDEKYNPIRSYFYTKRKYWIWNKGIPMLSLDINNNLFCIILIKHYRWNKNHASNFRENK